MRAAGPWGLLVRPAPDQAAVDLPVLGDDDVPDRLVPEVFEDEFLDRGAVSGRDSVLLILLRVLIHRTPSLGW